MGRIEGKVAVVTSAGAGIGTKDCPRLHEVSLERWDRVMDVNQRRAFIVMKYALPLILDSGGGSIINTASVGSFVATRNATPYLSAKGASGARE